MPEPSLWTDVDLVGRVHFNLAENPADHAAPFAFLATYTTQVSAQAKAQHLPLGQALRLYAAHGGPLQSLLQPVQRAAAQCDWLQRLVDAGEIYQPLRWTSTNVLQLLTDIPRLTAAGVVVNLDGLLQHPAVDPSDPGDLLKTTLRPYQQVGVRWLHLLSTLGRGACLADDMGLGKTIQVLALLLLARPLPGRPTSLIVAPASLLANWAAETARFAPSLRTLVAHPSAMARCDLHGLTPQALAATDLVVTSYGSVLRTPALRTIPWRLLVLDEAQTIKNPRARQTHAVKQLDAHARIALTGTPVENRLTDLWSIFDVINPGLLGTRAAFSRFTSRRTGSARYEPVRDVVRPYILRRVKTDRTVIADLPEKTEVKAYCHLTPAQIGLYQETVRELAVELRRTDGLRRSGLILTSLMRFKQICNHPSQWLDDGQWREADSGKLARLREIAATVAATQDKMLVFTQFRTMIAPIAAVLASVFGRPGLVLHGDTPISTRQELVQTFQEDADVPFFVLSLKAGGTGLNLMAASHVVHFDRWWNPAVENQATDRAFRIGQTKPVLVHKFVCRGSIEEKIDRLIDTKQQLADDLLGGTGAEQLLTAMSNDELLQLVTLDLPTAEGE